MPHRRAGVALLPIASLASEEPLDSVEQTNERRRVAFGTRQRVTPLEVGGFSTSHRVEWIVGMHRVDLCLDVRPAYAGCPGRDGALIVGTSGGYSSTRSRRAVIAVLEVGGDDAPVVGPIPGMSSRAIDDLLRPRCSAGPVQVRACPVRSRVAWLSRSRRSPVVDARWPGRVVLLGWGVGVGGVAGWPQRAPVSRRIRRGGHAAGGGDVELAVGVELGVPAGSVEEVVVVAAQQDEVGHCGGAAVLAVDDVVAFAPGGGAAGRRQWP
jgi:hypothetical protein